jgi:hypothetical protein
MKNGNLHLFNGLVLIFLLGINISIYLNRNEGYAYKEFLSYRQLYNLNDLPKITGFKNRGSDSIEVIVEPAKQNGSWSVKAPGKVAYNSHLYPVLKLDEGKYIYRIQDNERLKFPVIEIGIKHTPTSVYEQSGRKRESVTELFSCNLPVGNYKMYSLSEWRQGSPYSTAGETEIAKKLIAENTTVNKNDSSIVTIKKIATFILRELNSCRGIPSDSMNVISPVQRFRFAQSGKSKVWCGDFSGILAFFLSTQGIVCREVCLEGKLGGVYLAGHSFNEIYIKELQKWVFTDLTSKAIFVTHDGEYLNTLDLHKLHLLDPSNLKALTYANDSLFTVNYEHLKSFYDYYFSTNTQFVYYFSNYYHENTFSTFSKLKRYFSRAPLFAVYSGSSEVDNHKFNQKQTAAWILLFFILYLAAVFIFPYLYKK